MSKTKPQILANNGSMMVVLKPMGWSAHAAGPDTGPSLTEWLQEQGVRDGAPVHRLDKDTSGIILIGKGKEERARMSKWFADGEVHKEYFALVHGRIRKKGVIRRPLQDARRGAPLPAVTRYRLIEWLGSKSLIQLTLETGRKHQIRRHLQGIGHGVVGDKRYRTKGVPLDPGGLYLHEGLLVLPDERTWEAPLPERFLAELKRLQDDQEK